MMTTVQVSASGSGRVVVWRLDYALNGQISARWVLKSDASWARVEDEGTLPEESYLTLQESRPHV